MESTAKSTTHTKPFVVVLTGGPSSGKSSALALLRHRLSARGFQVLTVPENATHFLANSDGFQPEWAGTEAQVRMQRIFLDFQLEQEEAFKSFAALHPSKPAVLLLDCCTINSKVYLSDEQWEQVLKFPGKPAFTEEELFNRYDLVVHMVTCALHDNYEWGPGSNNPGRYHSPEQAYEQDQRCLKVFGQHPQLREVPHFSDFDEKIGKVAEFVNDALHIEGLGGKRRRRVCSIVEESALEKLVHLSSTSSSAVTCSFLDDRLQQSVRRHAKISPSEWVDNFKHWLHKVEQCDNTNSMSGPADADVAASTDIFYERRIKVQAQAGSTDVKSFLTRRVIGEEEYYAAVHSSKTVAATKLVLRFVQEGQYYEVFFFSQRKDLVLDFGANIVEFPAWLQVTGSRDLTREDSIAAVTPVPSKVDSTSHQPDQPPIKKARFLRAHSTEEAAFGGS